MPLKIVVLEDDSQRQIAMKDCLVDRFHQYEVRFFDDVSAMIGFLETNLQNVIALSLDHDLELREGPSGQMIDPGTGREVAEYLARQTPVCPVVIHTTNAVGALAMEMLLNEAHWQTQRVVPFDDLQWIATDWFRAMRRAIVGPTKARAVSKKST